MSSVTYLEQAEDLYSVSFSDVCTFVDGDVSSGPGLCFCKSQWFGSNQVGRTDSCDRNMKRTGNVVAGKN